MKKSLVLCLAGLLVCGLTGCNKKTENVPAPQAPAVEAAAPAPAAADAAAPAADTAAAAPAVDPAAAAANSKVDDAQIQAAANAIADQIAPRTVPAPEDVAAAPADATKTESGLFYKKIVTNDAGKAIPADGLVSLHYTGWTTDGKMFDTSTFNSEPTKFRPSNLIAGMKEALLLAKVGEKMRVWIPEELAYKGQPGAPAGMLVFEFDIKDVEVTEMPPKDIPEDATKLDKGLAFRVVKSTPDAKDVHLNDLVGLDFNGWSQQTGLLFQSSKELGEELVAPVNSMFPAWQEILPKVKVGDVVQMWVPQELGINPEGTDLPGMLIFEVTVNSAKELPATPADVAAAPADAQKTESGIAWRIITPGTGTEHPTAESKVKVHYSGWTTDGSMFDSSVVRGEPIEFALNQVIPGWSEAVQLMVTGEKRIVWIPEELAYKGMPGAPAGMLVFEIELLDIVK